MKNLNRKCAIASATIWVLASCASQKPDPLQISDVKGAFAAYCAPKKPKLGKAFVQSADFNEDGAIDYVIAASEYRCEDQAPFCGADGCEVQIFLSTPDGAIEQRFNGMLPEAPHIRKDGKRAFLVTGEGPAQKFFDAESATFKPAA